LRVRPWYTELHIIRGGAMAVDELHTDKRAGCRIESGMTAGRILFIEVNGGHASRVHPTDWGGTGGCFSTA